MEGHLGSRDSSSSTVEGATKGEKRIGHVWAVNDGIGSEFVGASVLFAEIPKITI